MKDFIASGLICFCSFFVVGQDTFHKLIYLEFPVNRFTSVLPTDSCYYVTGTFTDSISPVRTGVLLGKLDLQGELQNVKTVKHPDRLYFNDFSDLLENQQGNLFTVGVVNDAPQSVKGILYIYNHQGDTISTFDYRSPLFPDVNFVAPKEALQAENGNYLIANNHWADTEADNDLSLLAIDSTFNVVFYKVFGTSTWDEIASSLLLDEDGGYIIGAERTNDGQVLINYDNRTLIVKVDSSGEQAWQWLSPAGVLQDEAKSMIKTPDGGLVVASGTGTESDSNPNFHNLFWDAMIFKLDSNRNVVWSTLFRGDLPSTQTELTEMVEATDGNGFVASGIFLELTPDQTDAYHTSWLVKVSPEGDSLWARRYTYFDGEFVAPEVFDMKATPDGGYVLVGFTVNQYDVVTNPIVPAWIMKVDSFGCLVPGCHLTDATEETDRLQLELAIYPNPASDYLNFYLRTPRLVREAGFRIVSAGGRLMKTFQSDRPDATFIVPVWDWAAGVYFLQYVEEGVVRASERFVKQ
jgi:hypothetical protein